MVRSLHALFGLVLALPLAVLAISGTLLSLAPVVERWGVPAVPDISIAELAAQILVKHPGAEQLRRRPSGLLVLAYTDEDGAHDVVWDAVAGRSVAEFRPSDRVQWLSDLHRAFLGGDAPLGRGLAGLGALSLAVTTLSGAALLHRRIGTWQRLRARVKGTIAQRLHVLSARLALPGRLIAALTGVWLSATFFGILPNGMAERPEFPEELDGGEPLAAADLAALQAIPVSELKQLVFPFDADPAEPYEIATTRGAGYVDQATGAMAVWLPHGPARRVNEMLLMLHSGQGLWWFGLFVGASVTAVPLLGLTGALIWRDRRRALPPIRRDVALADADTVILVGSEGNTTWGFAQTLQDALSATGSSVHVAAMDALSEAMCGHRRMFLLTATYGDGAAPASAQRFLDRLAGLNGVPARGVAVLGFGDRDFDLYCAFAERVEAAVAAKGWPMLRPIERINRQSPQEFARWGNELGGILGVDLRLVHVVEVPQGQSWTLIRRQEFGQSIGAPVTILRFALPAERAAGLWGRLTRRPDSPRFQAGDLLGVVPPGDSMPRYYSLASGRADGFLEIAVRHHEHGLCSGYLNGLAPGGSIRGFIRPNPEFHLHPGRSPVVLIGTGCGIGPLAGFIRANRDRRPIRLYFGGRDRQSDFLYRAELDDWLAQGRLSGLVTSFLRNDAQRLPERLEADAAALAEMAAAGAQFMIVGGREMALEVLAVIDRALTPSGTTVAALRSEGRYVEAIF